MTTREVNRAMVSMARSIYVPTVNERKIKSRLHRVYSDGMSKGALTVELAEQLLGFELEKKDDPAFLAFLFNTKEMAEQVVTASGMIMDEIIVRIQDPDIKIGDLLKAASVVNDMLKVLTPKVESKTLDASLNQMSDEQIDALIEEGT